MTDGLIQLFEKAYFAELERKTQLNNALAFPLSILFGGVALLGYAITRIDPMSIGGAVSIPAIFVIVVCLALFVRHVAGFSIHGDYEYIWFMDQTLKFRNDLQKHYAQQDTEGEADRKFEETLIAELAKCAAINARLNDERADHIYRCRVHSLFFILGCFPLSVVGGISELVRS